MAKVSMSTRRVRRAREIRRSQPGTRAHARALAAASESSGVEESRYSSRPEERYERAKPQSNANPKMLLLPLTAGVVFLLLVAYNWHLTGSIAPSADHPRLASARTVVGACWSIALIIGLGTSLRRGGVGLLIFCGGGALLLGFAFVHIFPGFTQLASYPVIESWWLRTWTPCALIGFGLALD